MSGRQNCLRIMRGKVFFDRTEPIGLMLVFDSAEIFESSRIGCRLGSDSLLLVVW